MTPKERPIIFSAEMVRATLARRKSQTRRPIKGAKPHWTLATPEEWMAPTENRPAIGGYPKTPAMFHGDHGMVAFPSPFGRPGDRLWAKEGLHRPDGDPWLYRADDAPVMVSRENETAMIVWAHHKRQDYCPSIHMPRWASRITLEVTGERVERLQEISEDDAWAEGVSDCMGPLDIDGRVLFKSVWTKIYGAESWEENNWVRVVEFRMVQP